MSGAELTYTILDRLDQVCRNYLTSNIIFDQLSEGLLLFEKLATLIVFLYDVHELLSALLIESIVEIQIYLIGEKVKQVFVCHRALVYLFQCSLQIY